MYSFSQIDEIFYTPDCVDEVDFWYKRGDICANLGCYQKALFSFEQALKLRPNCCRTLVSRSAVLIFLGRYAEALEDCNKALEFQPDDEETLVIRGAALHGLGHYKEAYASCERALGIERKSLGQKLVDLTNKCFGKLKAINPMFLSKIITNSLPK
ncbi:hypothetical protein NUACC21_75190 [Scytonema sp. NUACC21]